ncbi:MAG: Uma2 family endonuclease [Dehalococcoidia bacterium]|nr:Uma2 family endonuclease [Dehalococcoidia bacterium]
MATRTISKLLPEVDYTHLEPLPDPPKEEPDMMNREGIKAFDLALDLYFANRSDVLVSGEGYLRQEAGNEWERFAPDGMVVFGVRPDYIIPRNGYVISEVGKPPDFVLEVASRSTGRRDYTVKRDGYERLGVEEYWRFDHTGGRFHDAALAGDLLVDGKYEPLPIHHDADGLIWGHSPVLGLDLCWVDGRLRFRDPATEDFLPRPSELDAQARDDRAARDAAESRAAQDRAAREAAEAEVARLREQIRRMSRG